MLRTGDSFILTPLSLISWEGWMKVLPMYLFLIRPISYGRPLASEYPIAALRLESGTPMTMSASAGDSLKRSFPDSFLKVCTLTFSMSLSGLAKYMYSIAHIACL